MANKTIEIYFEPGAEKRSDGFWASAAIQTQRIPGDKIHKAGDLTVRGAYLTKEEALVGARMWCKEANQWLADQKEAGL
jgi:hypothetical protein